MRGRFICRKNSVSMYKIFSMKNMKIEDLFLYLNNPLQFEGRRWFMQIGFHHDINPLNQMTIEYIVSFWIIYW